MCGRFTLTRPAGEISEILGIDVPGDIVTPTYNAAPGQNLPVISGKKSSGIKLMHWGFPFPQANTSQMIINARADSLKQKPMFRQKLQLSRCIIPADSFYEWKKQQGKKQPFRFLLENNELFCFAGLHGAFHTPQGNDFEAFVIITTNANQKVELVHNRMPVIFTPDTAIEWLHDDVKGTDINSLQPYRAENMTSYKVSPRVNNSANNSPELIEPWTDPGLTLF